jgi:hypothetical protein
MRRPVNVADERLRRGARVVIAGLPTANGFGIVLRVARDGSWADVRWRNADLGEWSKRHTNVSVLVPVDEGVRP